MEAKDHVDGNVCKLANWSLQFRDDIPWSRVDTTEASDPKMLDPESRECKFSPGSILAINRCAGTPLLEGEKAKRMDGQTDTQTP